MESDKNKWKEFCFQQNGCETCKYCDNSDCELEFWKDWARADERVKVERDFQNSDYWNDYLAKVLSDERERILEHQTIIYDIGGVCHKVVLVEDIKEQKNE